MIALYLSSQMVEQYLYLTITFSYHILSNFSVINKQTIQCNLSPSYWQDHKINKPPPPTVETKPVLVQKNVLFRVFRVIKLVTYY